ncbi:MAG: hypothetical protein SNJ75_04685, partial [Gemmataceae bacterium]
MSQLDSIERRLARLERHNLLLRVLLVGLLVLVVAFAVPSNQASARDDNRPSTGDKPTSRDDKPNTLKARSFVVTDEHGAKRAVLGMAKDGVGLIFYDSKGAMEAVLAARHT